MIVRDESRTDIHGDHEDQNALNPIRTEQTTERFGRGLEEGGLRNAGRGIRCVDHDRAYQERTPGDEQEPEKRALREHRPHARTRDDGPRLPARRLAAAVPPIALVVDRHSLPFVVRRSRFVVRSSFYVRRSTFVIRGSSFVVRGSDRTSNVERRTTNDRDHSSPTACANTSSSVGTLGRRCRT